MHELRTRPPSDVGKRTQRSGRDDRLPAWRVIARADAYKIGRARYLARQAALFQAAGGSTPPIGTD